MTRTDPARPQPGSLDAKIEEAVDLAIAWFYDNSDGFTWSGTIPTRDRLHDLCDANMVMADAGLWAGLWPTSDPWPEDAEQAELFDRLFSAVLADDRIDTDATQEQVEAYRRARWGHYDTDCDDEEESLLDAAAVRYRTAWEAATHAATLAYSDRSATKADRDAHSDAVDALEQAEAALLRVARGG